MIYCIVLLRKCMKSPWYAPKGCMWLVPKSSYEVFCFKDQEKLSNSCSFSFGKFPDSLPFQKRNRITNCPDTVLRSLISHRLLNNDLQTLQIKAEFVEFYIQGRQFDSQWTFLFFPTCSFVEVFQVCTRRCVHSSFCLVPPPNDAGICLWKWIIVILYHASDFFFFFF